MSDVAAEAIRGELIPVDPTTDIIEAVEKQPGIVLLDRVKFDQFYEKLAAKAPTDVDVLTKTGREVLRSFAAEVRREKASIDKARLRMTEEWRGMVSQANEAGKEIKERLEQLAVDVRKPLTDWEEAEDARVAEVDRLIAMFRSSRFVEMGEAADHIRERGTIVHNIAIDPAVFQDRVDEGEREKKETVDHLLAALARAEQSEKEAAELHRLREEAEARERADRERQEAEAAGQRRIEAGRQAEADRAAAEQAEAERVARAEQEAADRARREAEEAAQRERDEERRQHEAALAAERDRAEKAERDAQAERDRVAQAEADRKYEDEQREIERKKREEDKEYRTSVMTQAKEAMMSCGADEETARKIVLAIKANEVPFVRIEF